MSTTFAFQKLAPSDDESDGDNSNENKVLNLNVSCNESIEETVTNDGNVDIKMSKKLELIEPRKNLKKKFSIWSEVLMEEELAETVNSSLKVKQRKSKYKDLDDFSSLSKENGLHKFGLPKKSNKAKRRLKKKEFKFRVANDIAKQLKEERIDIIQRVVEIVGEEKARRLTAEVLDIESAGGMMTGDQSRRRSPGGVFFYLVKNEACITDEQKQDIFCDEIVKNNNRNRKKVRRQKLKQTCGKRDNKNNKNKNKKKKKKKNTKK
ncbi:hypothetical protein RDWZM_005232 [Blomia tropicalis]|uniref:Phosphorylated adapter RNA export protein n=1 Tax=Blomia tropicalis TaxID=40697 RepID=A0A9Q0M597_BLOTA|nr:hypothetical protein RDWZM_005232 [Blomia tropicalis]